MNLNDALGSLVVPVVGYLLYLARAWLLSHTTPTQYANLANLATTVVEGAEQAGKTLNLGSAQKYDFAAEALVTAAKRMGVKVKPAEVTVFIHQAVKAMKDADAYTKLVATP